MSSLIEVAKSGDEDAETQMRALIDTGADVNAHNGDGYTALMYTAEHGGEVTAHTQCSISNNKVKNKKTKKLTF